VLKVDERILLQSENISLTKGLYALVGRNGSGKSTLIKSILNQHAIEHGEIKINGKKLGDYKKNQIAETVSVVYSKASIFGNLTGLDVLKLGRIPHQSALSFFSSQDQQIVNSVIELMSLQTIVNKEFQILSDGEKQLIMIGRALVQDTPIILLDEPAAFLDIVNHHELIKTLNTLVNKTCKLIIYSTHQIQNIDNDCDGVLIITNKRLILLTDKGKFKNTIENEFGLK